MTLRQYIDHLKVVDGDEATRNLEDNRTLFWLWVWWSLRRHAEFGWQMPKRVRDNTAVAALTDAEGAGRLGLVLPAVVFKFTYCEALETPL